MKIQEEAFVITHSFEADLKTVYEMWTNPTHFSSWLGPAGAHMSFSHAEVKEGGISQWSMTTDDGQTKHGQLNFKIINQNHLLVYAQNFCDKDGNIIKAPFSATYPNYLLTTVNFVKESDNKTRVTVKWEIFGDAKEIERHTFLEMRPIMKVGWNSSFEKLESLLTLLKN
nr:SRPBCC domain-containing protein [Pedobacter sp. B4-66]